MFSIKSVLRQEQVRGSQRPPARRATRIEGPRNAYPTQSVYNVVLQKSIPAQICERVLYISNSEGYVDDFLRELTFAKQPDKLFVAR